MNAPSHSVSFLVYGRTALFTDPVTKTGGERHTYPVPTYSALRGILTSCYWKPTIEWVIDRVRILNPIQKESVSMRYPKYECDSTDLSYNTYLRDVAYQVEAHFEWANTGPEYVKDRIPTKHLDMALRYIQCGGRHYVFLGSRECQGYIEPCVFGEGEGAYDGQGKTSFGLMFHGYNYPEQLGRNALEARLWHAEMENGIITFPKPEKCPIVRFVREMQPTKFTPKDEYESVPEPAAPHNLGQPPAVKAQPTPISGDYMSWESKLCETYDNIVTADLQSEEMSGFLPIGHIMKTAQIQLDINGDGNLIPGSAIVVPKEDARTLISCSTKSQFRTIGPIPHLLFDSLQYLAGDYLDYGGSARDFTYQEYIDQVSRWCQSEAEHPLVRTVYDYLKQGTLVHDLIEEGVIPVVTDEAGTSTVPVTWTGEGKPPQIYSVCDSKGPLGATVRIRVIIEGLDPNIWNEPTVWESANSFNDLESSKDGKSEVCYILGKEAIPSRLHPYVKGKEKLISSYDTTGFTYRSGILSKAEHRVQISYEASQKIHITLRWLLQHHSFTIGPQTYLLWSTHNVVLPSIFADNDRGEEDIQLDDSLSDDLNISYARQVQRYIAGYSNHLAPDDEVVLLAIGSPTTGRCAITQYEPISTSKFLENIRAWKTGCWGILPVRGGFAVRTPSINEISALAAGVKSTPAGLGVFQRDLMNTIIFGHLLPPNIVRAVYRNTVHALSHLGGETIPISSYELTIATAVIRKFQTDRGGGQELQLDRSYVFGRILAYAYRIENYSYFLAGHKFRETNASKYLTQYTNTPAKVLLVLQRRLVPYKSKIGNTIYGRQLTEEMDRLVASLSKEDMTNKPLTENFLLGYHAQLSEFYRKRKDIDIDGTIT